MVLTTGPGAAPSEVCVCGRSNAGIAGANPKGGMDVCCAGSVLCDGPITGPGES